MVKILFFGIISEKTGRKEVTLSGNKTLSEVMEEIRTSYPGLCDLNYKIAINKCLVSDYNIIIEETAEIALLPPFSGG